MSQPEPSRADRDEAKRIADTINEHTHKVPHGIANMIASALAARSAGQVRGVRIIESAPPGATVFVGGKYQCKPGQSLAIVEPAPAQPPGAVSHEKAERAITERDHATLHLYVHQQRSRPGPVEVMLPGGKVHKIVDALSSSSQATGPRLQLVLQLDNLHEGMDVQRALKDSIPTAAESASRERDKP